MSCEGCCQGLGRRAFLEQVVAILGVTGIAACSSDLQTLPTIAAFTIKVSDYPALASTGGLAVVDNGSRTGVPIAVSRTGASTFLALSLICPHQGTTVEIVGAAFYCPGHRATFAADGSRTGGPAPSSLSRYAVVYDSVAGTLKIG
jgi:Rieske Fe-S protein